MNGRDGTQKRSPLIKKALPEFWGLGLGLGLRALGLGGRDLEHLALASLRPLEYLANPELLALPSI